MVAYKTRLKMRIECGIPVLDITMAGGRHYPATFTKLSVPVFVEPVNSYRESDPEFFLDFEAALLPDKSSFAESYDKRPRQRQLLADFETIAHDIIQDNVSGIPTMFKATKFLGFESDSGFEVGCVDERSRNYGSPKRESSGRGPEIRKGLKED